MQLALLYHKVFGHLEKFFAARIFSKIGVTVVVLTRQDSTHAALMPCRRTTTITAVLAEKRTWVPGGGFRGGPIQQRKHKGKLKDTEGTGAFYEHMRHLSCCAWDYGLTCRCRLFVCVAQRVVSLQTRADSSCVPRYRAGSLCVRREAACRLEHGVWPRASPACRRWRPARRGRAPVCRRW